MEARTDSRINRQIDEWTNIFYMCMLYRVFIYSTHIQVHTQHIYTVYT